MKRFGLLSLLVLLLCTSGAVGRELGRSRPARIWLREMRWELGPVFMSFDATRLCLGLQGTATRRHGIFDDRFSLALTRLKLEDPDGAYRFRFARLRFERRAYLRHRFYLAGGGGFHSFNPRTALRDWHHEIGAEVSTRFEPYLHVAMGWQLARVRLRRRWLPVTLRAEYLRGSAYHFDRPLSSGLEEVDPTGVNLGLRTEFRF